MGFLSDLLPDIAQPIFNAITSGGPRRQFKWNMRAAYKQNEMNLENQRNTLATNLRLQKEQRMYDSPEEQMRRYKEAGLNPHLIYGGGSGSATSNTGIERLKMKQENTMQSRSLATQTMIADMQNRSHLIATAAGMGLPAIHQVLGAYKGLNASLYDNPTAQAREQLPQNLKTKESEEVRNKYGVLTPVKTVIDDFGSKARSFFSPDRFHGTDSIMENRPEKKSRSMLIDSYNMFKNNSKPNRYKFNSLPKN